jgi:Uncharacterized protein involved in methicillin resistance
LRVEILQAHGEDARIWSELIASLPVERRDVHYLPGYAALYEEDGIVAQAALLRQGDSFVLYPFMRRTVHISGEAVLIDGKPACDIAVPYGIGGPVCSLDGAEAQRMYADFDALFHEWCCGEGIASEFLCPHMFTGAVDLIKANAAYQCVAVKPVVVVEVADGEAAIRKQLRKGHKAAITQAQKNAVEVAECVPDAALYDAFFDLYVKTMDRHNAAARWYFKKNYFWNCQADLPEGCGTFFKATVQGHLAGWCIVLHYGHTVYYHFAASDPQYYETKASTLMLYTVLLWAHGQGCKRVYLGGGATSAEDDGILRFKSGFTKNTEELCQGYRVMSSRHYDCLSSVKINAEQSAGITPSQPDYFPLYRRP